MSENLSAWNKDGDIPLWQLNTQLSYTILPSGYAEGEKAVEALERYKTQEELDYKRELVESHLKNLEAFSLEGHGIIFDIPKEVIGYRLSNIQLDNNVIDCTQWWSTC